MSSDNIISPIAEYEVHIQLAADYFELAKIKHQSQAQIDRMSSLLSCPTQNKLLSELIHFVNQELVERTCADTRNEMELKFRKYVWEIAGTALRADKERH